MRGGGREGGATLGNTHSGLLSVSQSHFTHPSTVLLLLIHIPEWMKDGLEKRAPTLLNRQQQQRCPLLLHWQLKRGKDTPQKMLPVSTAAIKTSPESWKALTLQTHLFPSLSRAPPAVSLAEHWRVCEANCRAQGQITAPWAHAHYRPLDVGGWHVCRHSWGGGRGAPDQRHSPSL